MWCAPNVYIPMRETALYLWLISLCLCGCVCVFIGNFLSPRRKVSRQLPVEEEEEEEEEEGAGVAALVVMILWTLHPRHRGII